MKRSMDPTTTEQRLQIESPLRDFLRWADDERAYLYRTTKTAMMLPIPLSEADFLALDRFSRRAFGEKLDRQDSAGVASAARFILKMALANLDLMCEASFVFARYRHAEGFNGHAEALLDSRVLEAAKRSRKSKH